MRKLIKTLNLILKKSFLKEFPKQKIKRIFSIKHPGEISERSPARTPDENPEEILESCTERIPDENLEKSPKQFLLNFLKELLEYLFTFRQSCVWAPSSVPR